MKVDEENKMVLLRYTLLWKQNFKRSDYVMIYEQLKTGLVFIWWIFGDNNMKKFWEKIRIGFIFEKIANQSFL